MGRLNDPLLDDDVKMGSQRTIKPNLPKRLAGEVVGTCLLLVFGCGCIMSNTYISHGVVEVTDNVS